MKRLASTLSLALVFSLASCGDDDKPAVDASTTPADTGTTPGADGAAPTSCTGSFAGVTQTQLAGAIAMSTGQKSCAPDVAAVCTGNIASIACQCGFSCLGMPVDAAKTCVSNCIKGQVSTLSDACNGCYAATVVCTQSMCLADCVADPAAAKCTQCQIDKGCRGAFAACSGLPTGPAPGDGGAPAGDGGATDAPGADGGAADTAAADTAAADVAASSDTSTD